jgi:hypothetical protein
VNEAAVAAIPEYGGSVATKKITITLPEDVIGRLRDFAKENGKPLSTMLAEMVEHEIRMREGLLALREWEAMDGPLTDEELAEAEAIIAKADAAALARAAKARKPGEAA